MQPNLTFTNKTYLINVGASQITESFIKPHKHFTARFHFLHPFDCI